MLCLVFHFGAVRSAESTLRVQRKSHLEHPLPAAALPQQSAFVKAAAEDTVFHRLAVCTGLAR